MRGNRVVIVLSAIFQRFNPLLSLTYYHLKSTTDFIQRVNLVHPEIQC